MNQKLLSLIVVIALFGSLRAAAGDPDTCATTSDPIQQCASDGTNVSTGAAACNAGYYFTFVGTTTSTCTICPIGKFLAADSATQKAVTGSTKTCTDCPAGSTTSATGMDAVADCICAKGTALNASATAQCTTIPADKKVDGALVVTTSDDATFALVSCDSTDGYQSAQNGAACTPCTARATGCATCQTNVGTCTACRAGFRDTDAGSGVTCGACTGNCATCDSTATTPSANSEKCLTAKDGFYVNGSDAVVACPDNATKCSWDKTTVPATPVVKVTEVQVGFYIKTGSTTVATACPTGRTNAAINSSTDTDGMTACPIVCAPNCVKCSAADKCDTCKDDHLLNPTATDKSLVCVAFTNETRPKTCLTAIGTTKGSCTSCDTTNTKRAKNAAAAAATPAPASFSCDCPDGYSDDSGLTTGATAVCRQCGSGVQTCNTPTEIVCTNAADRVAGLVCLPTTTAQGTVTGFYFDSTLTPTAFKACHTSCEQCTGPADTQCVTCKALAAPSVAPTEDDVTTLLTVWTNGTTYTAAAPGKCYDTCPDNYVVDEGRANCEMFGNILSAIVLIASVLLML